MNHSTLCASALILLLPNALAAGEALPTNELFPNGDFEKLRADRPLPTHWGRFRTSDDVWTAVDREMAFSGSTSLRLRTTDVAKRAGWARAAVKRPAVHPGAVILFSGHYRTREVTAAQNLGICARLTFVNTDNKVQATHYARGGDGTADWRRAETLLTLPDDILRVHPVLFLYGSGTVWWDAVSLRCYRPAEAVGLVAPEPDACVPEPRPELSWAPVPHAVDYQLELSTSPVFALDCTEQIGKLTQPRARPEKPLTPGMIYYWRVRARMQDGAERISLLKQGDVYRFHAFYAGTWERRSKVARDRLEQYRHTYTELTRFAKDNRMWEPFPRLKGGIANLESITAESTPESLRALTTLESDFADLSRFVTWWEKMFLNDGAFLATVDFAHPGLEKARASWAKQDVQATLRELLAYFRVRRRPVCFFDTENRPAPPSGKARVMPHADELCRHRYPIPKKLYGKKTFDFGPAFNWHVNPIVDREWPTSLHRHRQWQDLCDAYWVSYNERYAEEWRQQLLDWTKDNPIERWNPKTKRMAWSTLNAAARMIHRWPPALLQLRGAKAFDETTLSVFLMGIQQHGRFLMEKQARGGNWVIQEAKAQLMMGMFFPELKEAKQWLARGLARTRAELDKQVFDDGIHVERTPGYHGGCLESFVSVLQLLALNNIDFDGRDHFLGNIEKMYDFYLYGIKPDGTMPVLGDTGKARYERFLRKGYKRFHRPDFLYVATEGEEGSEPVETSHAFPSAGLYAMRSDWRDKDALFMFLDAGGHYGHCHLDNLTFELYAYGRTLIAEAGRYAYAAKINQYFKGTIGHNTILVDRTNMKREPAPQCRAWTTTPQFDYLHVMHQAYPAITHERRVLFVKPASAGADGYWVIADDVLGDGRHRCDQRFHFEPELKAEIKGLQARSADEKRANLLIAAPANSPDLALACEDGWVSYKWYGKRPATVAQFTREGPLPMHFDTILYPQRPGDQASLVVTRVPAEDATALRVEGSAAGRAFADLIVLRGAGQREPAELGGCRTDARVAYVRRDADGAFVRAFVEHGALLECDGRVLLEASEAVPYAAVSWTGSVMRVDAAAAESLRVHRPTGSQSVEVNGKPLPADQVGAETAVSLADVTPAVKRPIPREPGAPNIAYAPPDAKKTPTSLVAYRGAPDRAGSIIVEAERYHAEGGSGRLETSSRKVNASHDAILRWDNPGHWVEWTVVVPVEGDYALTLRVATSHGRVLRRIEIDGRTPDKRLEAVEFGYTGGWATHQDDWQLFHVGAGANQPVPLHLTAGKHTLRMTNLEGSLNVDYLLLSPLE